MTIRRATMSLTTGAKPLAAAGGDDVRAVVEGHRGREERPLRAVLIETSSIAGLGLARVLGAHGIEVAGETGEVEGGVELVRRSDADVVLVDVRPDPVALDVMARLPPVVGARVVILVGAGEQRLALAALGAGAAGCVAREAPEDDIIRAVDAAVRGESFISPIMAALLRRRLRPAGDEGARSAPVLTDRERDVLRLLTRGCANGEIARALYLSPATVKHHIASIFCKLHVRNRIQAAVRAIQDGLVEDL
jgi:DNA-binding NarL/FixJ family response regulator